MTTFSTPIPIEHYQQLIEVSLDLASTLDLNTLLKRINCLALELTDAQAAAIYFYDEGSRSLSLAVTDCAETEKALTQKMPRMQAVVQQAIESRQTIFLPDIKMDAPAGATVPHSVIASPMIVKERVIGILEVINKRTDIFTSADLGKLQVLSAQAAVAIENSRLFQQVDLISDFVHELRTPLTAINTINELFQREDITPQERRQFGSLMQNEINRLKALTNNFLDYSRLESGRLSYHPTRFSPADLIRECFEISRPKMLDKRLMCTVKLPAELPDIEADHDKIKQVLINLIGNAIKYNHPDGDIYINAWNEAQMLCISIQDTGIGIPAEALPHIGERFYRAANAEQTTPGTGLGMTISKQIIEGHHGSLEIASQLGQGTTVTVKLPL